MAHIKWKQVTGEFGSNGRKRPYWNSVHAREDVQVWEVAPIADGFWALWETRDEVTCHGKDFLTAEDAKCVAEAIEDELEAEELELATQELPPAEPIDDVAAVDYDTSGTCGMCGCGVGMPCLSPSGHPAMVPHLARRRATTMIEEHDAGMEFHDAGKVPGVIAFRTAGSTDDEDNTPEDVNPGMIRESLMWTQEEAAKFFGVSTRTWRIWERERSPPPMARRFLWLFDRMSKGSDELKELHGHVNAKRL